MESHRVDGNDVLAVYAQMQAAVAACSAGGGPVLIEAVTYRHGGHHVNDPGQYMPEDKLRHYKEERDPCLIARRYLLELGGAAEAEAAAIEERVEARMEEAVAYGKADAEPDLNSFLEAIEEYA